jgi:hypothetical protein
MAGCAAGVVWLAGVRDELAVGFTLDDLTGSCDGVLEVCGCTLFGLGSVDVGCTAGVGAECTDADCEGCEGCEGVVGGGLYGFGLVAGGRFWWTGRG